MFEKLYLENNVLQLDCTQLNHIKELSCTIKVCLLEKENTFQNEDWKKCVFVGSTASFLNKYKALGAAVIAVLDKACDAENDLFSFKYAVENIEAIDKEYLELIFARFNKLPFIAARSKGIVIKEMDSEAAIKYFSLCQKEPELFNENIKIEKNEIQNQEIEKAAKSYIENVYDLYGYGIWAVYNENEKHLLGFAGLYDFTVEECSYTGISYYVLSPYRNQNIASNAIEAILKYAKEKLFLEEIYCLTDKNNEASIKTAQKAGFVFKRKVLENNYLLYLRKL